MLTNWWLSLWTGAETVNLYKIQVLHEPSSINRGRYLGGYFGFAMAFVLFTFLRSLNNLTASLRASKLVHHDSLSSLVRAPVSFFDTTPVGRILNRFAKDCDDMVRSSVMQNIVIDCVCCFRIIF